MDMNVRRLEFIRGNSVFIRMRTDKGNRRQSGFFHDVSEFPRQADFPFAVHRGSLHRQRGAAHGRPCQSRHRAHFFLAAGFVRLETRRAQKFLRFLPVHFYLGQGSIVRITNGNLPADRAHRALQSTHARFHGIAFDNRADSVLRKFRILLRKTVRL